MNDFQSVELLEIIRNVTPSGFGFCSKYKSTILIGLQSCHPFGVSLMLIVKPRRGDMIVDELKERINGKNNAKPRRGDMIVS